MSAKLLEGKPVADAVMSRVASRAASLRKVGVVPGLATILVGDDPASAGYVRKKHEACASAGFWSENLHLPASTTERLRSRVRSSSSNRETNRRGTAGSPRRAPRTTYGSRLGSRLCVR